MTSQAEKLSAGVIGAGRMGAAIAAIFAAKDYKVILVDPSAAALSQAAIRIEKISQSLGLAGDVASGVSFVQGIGQDLSTCCLVIEAAPEKLPLKQAIFSELDKVCGDATILATNTSVIPVTQIGQHTRYPKRVIGTHFWNPPYAVRLVEVVQTDATDAWVIAETIRILRAVGQSPVHVKKDIPGFIGNRLQHALKREAIALVQSGVCDAETLDFVVKNSFGARLGIMGPLEQSDLVGLNLTLDIHDVILKDLDCSKAPQALLVDKVAQGKIGASVGEGFRHWTDESRQELQNRLDQALLPRK